MFAWYRIGNYKIVALIAGDFALSLSLQGSENLFVWNSAVRFFVHGDARDSLENFRNKIGFSWTGGVFEFLARQENGKMVLLKQSDPLRQATHLVCGRLSTLERFAKGTGIPDGEIFPVPVTTEPFAGAVPVSIQSDQQVLTQNHPTFFSPSISNLQTLDSVRVSLGDETIQEIYHDVGLLQQAVQGGINQEVRYEAGQHPHLKALFSFITKSPLYLVEGKGSGQLELNEVTAIHHADGTPLSLPSDLGSGNKLPSYIAGANLTISDNDVSVTGFRLVLNGTGPSGPVALKKGPLVFITRTGVQIFVQPGMKAALITPDETMGQKTMELQKVWAAGSPAPAAAAPAAALNP
ncbi:MAG: hypothetical protein M3O22_03445 [Pseudomonadota bacterium]|nr:hypothetical protein [Pseudomonadota bacterium]